MDFSRDELIFLASSISADKINGDIAQEDDLTAKNILIKITNELKTKANTEGDKR